MSEYLKYGNLRAFLYMQKQVCSDFCTIWVLSRLAFLFSGLFPPSKECLKIEPSESWAKHAILDSVQHRVLIIKMSTFGLNKAKLVSLIFNKKNLQLKQAWKEGVVCLSLNTVTFSVLNPSSSSEFPRLSPSSPLLVISYKMSLSDELMLRFNSIFWSDLLSALINRTDCWVISFSSDTARV